MVKKKLRRQGKNIDELALELNTLEHLPPAVSGVPLDFRKYDNNKTNYNDNKKYSKKK
jgi:hypothetical protein